MNSMKKFINKKNKILNVNNIFLIIVLLIILLLISILDSNDIYNNKKIKESFDDSSLEKLIEKGEKKLNTTTDIYYGKKSKK
jgi:hypothetical protein|tara:strand:+ start:2695 stop:2940 length:246 start_codon:yes stop_codon:yes gene_type:complete